MGKVEKFDVDGHVIMVRVRRKTHMHGHNGYRAWVKDNRGEEMKIDHINVLWPDEAIERAYVRFVKERVA